MSGSSHKGGVGINYLEGRNMEGKRENQHWQTLCPESKLETTWNLMLRSTECIALTQLLLSADLHAHSWRPLATAAVLGVPDNYWALSRLWFKYGLNFQSYSEVNVWVFFFWLSHIACGILVLQPEVELEPSAVKVWLAKHWTTREFPEVNVFKSRCESEN